MKSRLKEDDNEGGGCSEENEGNEDKGESVIHKIDTVETIHLDTSCDLVIDESMCKWPDNEKCYFSFGT